MYPTTVVNVKWVLDSVFVNESNISVALHVVSEGEFARPISIGVACSPVIASDVSAGNVLTYVCMHLMCMCVHIIYACTVYFMYALMYMWSTVCMYVHSLYFMCIYTCNPLKHLY